MAPPPPAAADCRAGSKSIKIHGPNTRAVARIQGTMTQIKIRYAKIFKLFNGLTDTRLAGPCQMNAANHTKDLLSRPLLDSCHHIHNSPMGAAYDHAEAISLLQQQADLIGKGIRFFRCPTHEIFRDMLKVHRSRKTSEEGCMIVQPYHTLAFALLDTPGSQAAPVCPQSKRNLLSGVST